MVVDGDENRTELPDYRPADRSGRENLKKPREPQQVHRQDTPIAEASLIDAEDEGRASELASIASSMNDSGFVSQSIEHRIQNQLNNSGLPVDFESMDINLECSPGTTDFNNEESSDAPNNNNSTSPCLEESQNTSIGPTLDIAFDLKILTGDLTGMQKFDDGEVFEELLEKTYFSGLVKKFVEKHNVAQYPHIDLINKMMVRSELLQDMIGYIKKLLIINELMGYDEGKATPELWHQKETCQDKKIGKNASVGKEAGISDRHCDESAPGSPTSPVQNTASNKEGIPLTSESVVDVTGDEKPRNKSHQRGDVTRDLPLMNKAARLRIQAALAKKAGSPSNQPSRNTIPCEKPRRSSGVLLRDTVENTRSAKRLPTQNHRKTAGTGNTSTGNTNEELQDAFVKTLTTTPIHRETPGDAGSGEETQTKSASGQKVVSSWADPLLAFGQLLGFVGSLHAEAEGGSPCHSNLQKRSIAYDADKVSTPVMPGAITTPGDVTTPGDGEKLSSSPVDLVLEHEHMGVSPFEPDDVRPERKINVKTEDDREGTAASKLDKEKHSRESADSATSPNDSLDFSDMGRGHSKMNPQETTVGLGPNIRDTSEPEFQSTNETEQKVPHTRGCRATMSTIQGCQRSQHRKLQRCYSMDGSTYKKINGYDGMTLDIQPKDMTIYVREIKRLLAEPSDCFYRNIQKNNVVFMYPSRPAGEEDLTLQGSIEAEDDQDEFELVVGGDGGGGGSGGGGAVGGGGGEADIDQPAEDRDLTQVGSVMTDDGDSDDEDDQVDDDNVWRCNRDRGAIGGNNDQS